MRRVSQINQKGEVTWQMREGTILVCPMAGQTLKSDDITIITQTERGGSANKKQRIIEMKSNDQITVSITRSEEIPLDSDEE